MKNGQNNGNTLYNLFNSVTPDEVKLIAEVARQTTEGEFLNFIKTGEMAAVKLSPAQMKILAGGSLMTGILGVGAGIRWVEHEVAVYAASFAGKKVGSL